jgi:hypothetical protein
LIEVREFTLGLSHALKDIPSQIHKLFYLSPMVFQAKASETDIEYILVPLFVSSPGSARRVDQ